MAEVYEGERGVKIHPAAEIFPAMTADEFAGLKADIAQHGVREAVWTFGGSILDGRHRWRACEEIGIECPSRQYEGDDPVAFVISLNLARRHLSESQRAVVGIRIATLTHGGDRVSDQAANLPVATQAEAAQLLNISERSIRQAKQIEREAPHLIPRIESGEMSLNAAAREVRHAEKLALPVPADTYRVIYADPPWSYGNSGVIGDTDNYGRAERHYPTMTIAELCELPVKAMAGDEAVLFMWVTSPLLAECFPVIEAWGFRYKTSFVWDKVKHNFGHYNSVRHELLLIATRGSCTPDNTSLIDSVQVIERTEKHSEKPEEFRTIIDTLYPRGKRIELFARATHAGWDSWGNEAAA